VPIGYRDTIHIDPPYADALAQAGLHTVGAVLDCVGDRLSAWSRTTDTIQVLLKNGSSIFIKRYHHPRWKNRFKAMFRGTFFGASRVRAEYRALMAMRGLGIQTVRPIAYGERRHFHFLTSSFLITEAVPGAVSLATYAQQISGVNHTPSAFRRRREVLATLALQIRHMHEQGFIHGDLFARNIMVRLLGEASCEFYFIDAGLGRRVYRKGRRQTLIVDELAGLMAIAPQFCSRTDMARFVKAYFARDRLGPQDRDWMHRVAERSDAFRKHELLRLRYNEMFNTHLRNLDRLDRAGQDGDPRPL